MTFEGYKLHQLRLKHRLEREKQGKLNLKRMEREKKFNNELLVNPDETLTGVG